MASCLAEGRQEGGEFLAAEAKGIAGRRTGIAQRLPDELHDEVSRIMAELVVEALEMVDVDHQAGERLARCSRACRRSVRRGSGG
jgi:hypothetical protein